MFHVIGTGFYKPSPLITNAEALIFIIILFKPDEGTNLIRTEIRQTGTHRSLIAYATNPKTPWTSVKKT